jgi:hypothetical protein
MNNFLLSFKEIRNLLNYMCQNTYSRFLNPLRFISVYQE